MESLQKKLELESQSFRVKLEQLNTEDKAMEKFDRITLDPAQMGGKPCIRHMRVTVGTIVGLVASGHSTAAILELYPYLESEDITQALRYAAWRADEREVAIAL